MWRKLQWQRRQKRTYSLYEGVGSIARSQICHSQHSRQTGKPRLAGGKIESEDMGQRHGICPTVRHGIASAELIGNHKHITGVMPDPAAAKT